MKNLLIVGCGRLGYQLARRLFKNKKNYRIWGIKRSLTSHQKQISWISWLLQDIRKLEIGANIPSKISHILYCPTPDKGIEASYQEIFIEGLQRLLRVVNTKFLNRLIFVSSSSVYGDHQGSWVNENSYTFPTGFNGRILLEAEHFLEKLDFPTISIRLSGIYGPSHFGLLKKLWAGEIDLTNIFNKRTWTNRIHIYDAVSAIEHLICAPTLSHSVFIATDDTPMLLNDLYFSLAQMLNIRVYYSKSLGTESGKRLLNTRLKESGWTLRWPNTLNGYSTLIDILRQSNEFKKSN